MEPPLAHQELPLFRSKSKAAQAHGYGGLNIRNLAEKVSIKDASIYYHFPSKADLGAAVARRYWEDSAADLDAL
jgi:TetR/AcrR family transcriptional repressor of nem operon